MDNCIENPNKSWRLNPFLFLDLLLENDSRKTTLVMVDDRALSCLASLQSTKLNLSRIPRQYTPWKINMMEVWKMIFMFNWVMF